MTYPWGAGRAALERSGIVVLVAVGLAGYLLPILHPRQPPAGCGLAAAVLLVGSLLAHELAHALVAKRDGVAVDGITLWLLGAVARLRGGARGPGVELRLGMAGLAPSLALSLVFGLLAGLAGTLSAKVLVAVLGYRSLLSTAFAGPRPAVPISTGIRRRPHRRGGGTRGQSGERFRRSGASVVRQKFVGSIGRVSR